MFRRAPTIIFWLSLAAASHCPAEMEADVSKEYQVKAACLFHFAEYTQWPAAAFSGPAANLEIGILGDDPFGPVLDDIIRAQKIHGHPLAVKRASDAGGLKGCQIVFVSKSEKTKTRQILAALAGTSALIVGDMDGFATRGGIINFILVNGKVRFEINMGAARAKGLKIGSQCLGLGTIVKTEKGWENP
jgi:hypothetical protein